MYWQPPTATFGEIQAGCQEFNDLSFDELISEFTGEVQRTTICQDWKWVEEILIYV